MLLEIIVNLEFGLTKMEPPSLYDEEPKMLTLSRNSSPPSSTNSDPPEYSNKDISEVFWEGVEEQLMKLESVKFAVDFVLNAPLICDSIKDTLINTVGEDARTGGHLR